MCLAVCAHLSASAVDLCMLGCLRTLSIWDTSDTRYKEAFIHCMPGCLRTLSIWDTSDTRYKEAFIHCMPGCLCTLSIWDTSDTRYKEAFIHCMPGCLCTLSIWDTVVAPRHLVQAALGCCMSDCLRTMSATDTGRHSVQAGLRSLYASLSVHTVHLRHGR